MSPTRFEDAEMKQRFFGKYRGLVVENVDPLQVGRILAQVPDVLGETLSSWALPCVPAAGIQAGCFIVPPVGSQVWIEFEQGDPDFPIWTGGFWSLAADVPVVALVPPAIPPGQTIVLQTTGQNTLALSDAPPSPTSGGIVLQAAGGAMIVVNEAGVFINNGKGATIALIGPAVSINSGALSVVGATVSVDGAPLTPGA
jgi:Type VI secretion system/phage-baseplate injector OB domain